jgi:glyceraldehyde-3-phosphate dehydrogenase (NADP+)
MVHESIADTFIPKFADAIDALKLGCPWESGVSLTPLPEPGKPAYIKELLDDALEHGAKVINKNAGHDRTMVFPSVVYPVNSSMRVYNEEQFGPIIPIVTFKNTDELYEYLAQSQYGQQASVFSKSPDTLGEVIDVLVNQVARVNINSLSQRGPDSLPFTGRKDSAYGTLSISDALRVFSIRTCVAAKDTSNQTSVLTDVMQAHKSQFLRMEYHF